MSILSELLNRLSKNDNNLGRVETEQATRSLESLEGCIQESGNTTQEGIELLGGTGMICTDVLEIQKGTGSSEKELSEVLLELLHEYDNAGSEEEKYKIANEIAEIRENLKTARGYFDRSIQLNQDLRDDVRKIISHPKSPYYNPKGKKQFHEVDVKESGKVDDYHDKLEQLYGKNGLKNFFGKYISQLNQAIPKEDLKWASKRYKVVVGPIIGSPILSSIPILAGAAGLYPLLASSIHIVPYAIGAFMLGTCFKKFITEGREKHNKRVFRARERIAIDLGLRERYASWTAEGINANDAKAEELEEN